MAKATRKRGAQPQRKKSNGSAPGWLWMLGGFLPGMFLAVLVHLHHQQQDGISITDRAASSSAREESNGGADHRPRFEFYKLLSEMEVVVPDEPPEPRRRPQQETAAIDPTEPSPPIRPEAPPVPEAPGSQADEDIVQYVVQAGSFRSHGDADRLKARLALMGVEAEIQSVTIEGGGTWHRVRIGPIADRSRVDRVRQRLEAEQVDSILLRVQG
ncbi:MAG: SPOR domain-containing protein [Ectothiorhodospiraceae bacterium]|nr:SPOR domain-containing protein [Ectothiorhodospiraceae bacterium]MCH8505775.1 SPOR domain-containing protein [Ectothiorhodospiraceae bacterium]